MLTHTRVQEIILRLKELETELNVLRKEMADLVCPFRRGDVIPDFTGSKWARHMRIVSVTGRPDINNSWEVYAVKLKKNGSESSTYHTFTEADYNKYKIRGFE